MTRPALAPYFSPHWLAGGGAPRVLDGTVLVADLKGFSACSSLLFDRVPDPDRVLARVVNGFFAAALGVADQYGGSPLGFDGDALSILFDGEAHARRAVAAAEEVRRATAGSTAPLPGGESVVLDVTQGLASGRFLSASVGGEWPVCVLLGRAATVAVAAQKAGAASEIVAAPAFAAGLSAAGPPPTAPAVAPDWLEAHFPRELVPRLAGAAAADGARPVAAIFANVDGLGALADAAGVGAVGPLGRFLGGVRAVVENHGGVLNKVNAYSTGDKYLALFGLSGLGTADPTAAVVAAAGELARLAAVQPFPLRQRIGLSVGSGSEVVVGTPRRRELTVMGRPVNEAVHLMAQAGWGGIAAVGVGPAPPAGAWTVGRERIRLKGAREECTVTRYAPAGAM